MKIFARRETLNGSQVITGLTREGWVIILAAGIIFVLLFILVTSIRIVQPGQAAIVTRFGKLDEQARYEGTYVEPFANINFYDLKVLTNSSIEEAGTNNLQAVKVEVTTTYKLKGDKLFEIFKTIGSEEDVIHKIIEPNTSAAVKASTTEYDAETLLRSRVELTQKIQDKLGKILGQYNVELQNVAVTNINFTDADFNKSIEQKQIAEQNAEKAKYDLQRVQTEAQQQQALQQSLTPEILQKMWIEKWDGHLPSTVYSGNGSNLYLPFNK